MRLRLFIGEASCLPFLRQWLIKRHPEASCNPKENVGQGIHFFQTWENLEAEELVKLSSLLGSERFIFNIFLEPKHFFSFLELSTKIPRIFNHAKKYYHVEIKENLQISWHESGADISLSSAQEPRALHLNFSLETLYLVPKVYPFDTFSHSVKIDRPFKRNCIFQMQEALKEKSLREMLKQMLPQREKLQHKILKEVESKSDINALSFLLNWNLFPEPLDENLLNNFLKEDNLFYFQNLSGERKNLALALGREKLFSLLSKISHSFSDFLFIADSFSLASLMPLETVKNALNQERIRDFQDIHDLLVNENYYENMLKANTSLATAFSEIQSKMKKLNNENFIVPLNIETLKIQAETFKNCSLIYAQEVVNKQLGFLAYYYENTLPVACLYFDQYRNIIEVSGVRNRELSLEERNKIHNLLQRS